MISLSIQCSSTALKESVETNGSGGDLKTCEELKFLLEEYAKLLGCSLSDAVDMITEISQGARSSEVSFSTPFSFHLHSSQLVLLILTLLEHLCRASAQIWWTG